MLTYKPIWECHDHPAISNNIEKYLDILDKRIKKREFHIMIQLWEITHFENKTMPNEGR